MKLDELHISSCHLDTIIVFDDMPLILGSKDCGHHGEIIVILGEATLPLTDK